MPEQVIRLLKDADGNVFVRAEDVMDMLRANKTNINNVAMQYNQLIKSFDNMIMVEKMKGDAN